MSVPCKAPAEQATILLHRAIPPQSPAPPAVISSPATSNGSVADLQVYLACGLLPISPCDGHNLPRLLMGFQLPTADFRLAWEISLIQTQTSDIRHDPIQSRS